VTVKGTINSSDFEFDSRKPHRRLGPFPFVLDELAPLSPVVKRAFGFTYVYIGEKLVCGLRQSVKQPGSNGLWLFTTIDKVESLSQEFPDLPRRCIWRSKKDAWFILASRLANFEELALKACELILARDSRIGKLTRGMAGRY
jgi:hypothetical protein